MPGAEEKQTRYELPTVPWIVHVSLVSPVGTTGAIVGFPIDAADAHVAGLVASFDDPAA